MKLPWKPTELHEWFATIAITIIIVVAVLQFHKRIKGLEDPNNQKVEVPTNQSTK